VIYPDAPHAFHADYRPSYRKPAAEDGWKRCLAWFRRTAWPDACPRAIAAAPSGAVCFARQNSKPSNGHRMSHTLLSIVLATLAGGVLSVLHRRGRDAVGAVADRPAPGQPVGRRAARQPRC
jgi:hypothetical protein